MKNKEKIIKDFKKKLDILKAHNKSYFEEDNPKISDHEYDKIKKDIIDLSKKHNFLKDLNFVGSPPSNKFRKIKHLHPMLSLSNVDQSLIVELSAAASATAIIESPILSKSPEQ